jgi:hypothetical protein
VGFLRADDVITAEDPRERRRDLDFDEELKLPVRRLDAQIGEHERPEEILDQRGSVARLVGVLIEGHDSVSPA